MKDELTDQGRDALIKAAEKMREAGLSPVFQMYRLADSELLLRKAIAEARPDTGEPSKPHRLNPLSFPRWGTFPLKDEDEFWTFWNGIESFLRGEFPALGANIAFSPTFQEALCRLRQIRAKDLGWQRLSASEHYRDPASTIALRVALDTFRVADRTEDADRVLFERKLDAIAKAIALQPKGRGNQPLRASQEERDYHRHLYRKALETLLRVADQNTPEHLTEEKDLLREVARVLPLSTFPDYYRNRHAPGLARHLARLRSPRKGERKNYYLRSAVWLLEDLRWIKNVPPRTITDQEARRAARSIAATWKRHTFPEPLRSRYLEKNWSDDDEFE